MGAPAGCALGALVNSAAAPDTPKAVTPPSSLLWSENAPEAVPVIGPLIVTPLPRTGNHGEAAVNVAGSASVRGT
jgi:hypothetical protein